ncbi:MAG: hypothetical protein ACK4LQ_02055 [Pararhodobacter sp.]
MGLTRLPASMLTGLAAEVAGIAPVYPSRSAALAALPALAEGTVFHTEGLALRKQAGGAGVAGLADAVQAHGPSIDLRPYIDGAPADLRPALDWAISVAATAYAQTGVRHTVHGGGLTVPLSAPITGGDRRGVRLDGMHCVPAGGSSWSADTAMFMLNAGSGSGLGSGSWFWEFGSTFSANGLQSCPGLIRAQSIEFLTLHGVQARGFTEFCLRTRTKCGQLKVTGCNFGQRLWGETGWNQEADNTAILYDIATADYALIGNIGYYAGTIIKIATNGPGQLIGNHVWNDRPSPSGYPAATFTTDPIAIEVDAPNCTMVGNYIDNGLLLINADLFATTSAGMILVANRFQRNANGVNAKILRLTTSTANQALAGLIMGLNSFPTSIAAPVQMSASGSGSYVAPHLLQCVIEGNLRSDGAAVAGLPRHLVPNAMALLEGNIGMALKSGLNQWGKMQLNDARNGVLVSAL